MLRSALSAETKLNLNARVLLAQELKKSWATL